MRPLALIAATAAVLALPLAGTADAATKHHQLITGPAGASTTPRRTTTRRRAGRSTPCTDRRAAPSRAGPLPAARQPLPLTTSHTSMHTDTPITVKGRNGTITFDGQAVTISRTGFLAMLSQGRGDKWIPLNRISAVQLKPNGIKAGYIEFTIAGGNELHNRRSRSKDRVRNENLVLFSKKVETDMRALVQAIQAAIAQQQT